MKTAKIATAKNQLSRLIKRVKRGEVILITDRNQPVAQLVPVREQDETLNRLFAAGLLIPRKGPPLDVEGFLRAPRPKLSEACSLVKASWRNGRKPDDFLG